MKQPSRVRYKFDSESETLTSNKLFAQTNMVWALINLRKNRYTIMNDEQKTLINDSFEDVTKAKKVIKQKFEEMGVIFLVESRQRKPLV